MGKGKTFADLFFETKRREVEAATKKVLEEMSWPRLWLDNDLADAALYASRFYPVKITNANYGYASDLFGDKMENKNKAYYRVFNENTKSFLFSRYETEAGAIHVAEEQAKRSPGHEYVVLKAVASTVVPAITTRLS